MIIKRRSYIDIFVFVIFTLSVVNIISIHLFYDETKRQMEKDLMFFIKSKKTALDVHYNYILRDTQKIANIKEKLNAMKYHNNIYFYTVYVEANNQIKYLEKSSQSINDSILDKCISEGSTLLYMNYRYFVVYDIHLNSKFNKYVNKNKQGILVLESLPLEVLFPINENELDFRNRKMVFKINVYGIDIALFLNVKRFFKIHAYKLVLFNILALFFDIVSILSSRKIMNRTDNMLESSISDTVDSIDSISKFISSRAHMFHTLDNIDIAHVPKNADKRIVESLSNLNTELHKSVLSIREETIVQSRTIITESKSKVKHDLEKAFKSNIPDLDISLDILDKNIDIYSYARPATLTEADGVYFTRIGNKVFFMVYDVSGHDIYASYKSVRVYTVLDNIIHNLNYIDMKDIIRNMWKDTSYLGTSTVDAALFCIDFERGCIEISFFGSMFFVYFDNAMCISGAMCSNNISQLQYVEGVSAYIEGELAKFQHNIIPFNNTNRIVIMTDGYTDATMKESKDIFGEHRMRKLLHDYNYIRKSKKFTNMVIREFESLTTEKTEDDRTVLTVSINNLLNTEDDLND